MEKNIIIELATPQTEYIKNMVSSLSYYGYIPIFMYPYVNSPKELYNRAMNRGIGEGRFVGCNFIDEAIKKCLEGFCDIQKEIKNYDNCVIVMYDASTFFENTDAEYSGKIIVQHRGKTTKNMIKLIGEIDTNSSCPLS
jgi:hypothetical protein